jgi:hypothetical protein
MKESIKEKIEYEMGISPQTSVRHLFVIPLGNKILYGQKFGGPWAYKDNPSVTLCGRKFDGYFLLLGHEELNPFCKTCEKKLGKKINDYLKSY